MTKTNFVSCAYIYYLLKRIKINEESNPLSQQMITFLFYMQTHSFNKLY